MFRDDKVQLEPEDYERLQIPAKSLNPISSGLLIGPPRLVFVFKCTKQWHVRTEQRMSTSWHQSRTHQLGHMTTSAAGSEEHQLPVCESYKENGVRGVTVLL